MSATLQLQAGIRFFADALKTGKPYSVFSLIDQHGSLKMGAPWPGKQLGIKRGRMKMCYMNAQRLALFDDRFTYCEGYALNMIPVLHGWVEDYAGNIIDPTWKKAEDCAYCGVRFKRDYVARIVSETKLWSPMLDNMEQRWPLLTGATPLSEALILP